MDDVPSRDQPETEKLEPSPDLLARRRQRDAQAYRDWCESAYGMIDVGPEVFHPADILTTLAPDAARRGSSAGCHGSAPADIFCQGGEIPSHPASGAGLR